ncbi:gamma carbonic anhydrase family protein [Sphingomonas sp. DBB INV C78]|uniref:gamma carbonic anhydrase family protein n=1 Tax=Sphingomonas sp. DBB INV C78 TaxID=3349434 RepID=UPI0036D2CC10
MEGVTILPFRGVSPDIARAGFIAPGARLIGDVTLGEGASVWYNCVLRGDVAPISVGARTNIQDGTIVHVTTKQYDTVIGEDCLIGHLAIVHGCRLHDRAFVGLGAIVMDGCEIESDAMLAAGAMLTPGKRIPSGQMWAGRPAKYVRDLTAEQLAGQQAGVANYVRLAREHAQAVQGQG